MDTDTKLILTFITNTGEQDKYTIPRADINLNSSEIFTLMNQMITNGYIISASKGSPKAAESADLVEYTYRKLI